MIALKQGLIAWWRLSRVPFLSVGVLPLILGFVLAWRWGYGGNFKLYGLAGIAVILIMEMTYYIGEWNDLQGDRLNDTFNSFSGGSRVLVEGTLPPWVPLLLGYLCLAVALLIGLIIFFRYGTGPWTLPLGAIGIVSGFFYSNGPFRWAHRGVGEVLIGICYSWLPIATGFYLFTGFFSHQIILLSIPIGLSIFNLILINEFADEEPDRAVGKRNLLVRFGKERMAELSLGVSVLIGLSLVKVISTLSPAPFWLYCLSGIPLLLLVWNMIQVWREKYWNLRTLESLCRNSLMINLSITMILTLQLTLR
jgi:1,4-dihydroxy-2-naphthoate octaprenyltransferase